MEQTWIYYDNNKAMVMVELLQPGVHSLEGNHKTMANMLGADAMTITVARGIVVVDDPWIGTKIDMKL